MSILFIYESSKRQEKVEDIIKRNFKLGDKNYEVAYTNITITEKTNDGMIFKGNAYLNVTDNAPTDKVEYSAELRNIELGTYVSYPERIVFSNYDAWLAKEASTKKITLDGKLVPVKVTNNLVKKAFQNAEDALLIMAQKYTRREL